MGDGQSLLARQVAVFSEQEGLFDCDGIVVALSGGPDSVALLHILRELRLPHIFAVHVNHNLRPGDADSDEKLAADLCRKLGVELKVVSLDIAEMARENKCSVEQAGREARYKTFEEYARELETRPGIGEVRIAVAHHRDDIAETMLMNLFRGSGLDGLVSPKSISGKVIRPLLCADKAAIIEYINSRGIPYATDFTNSESIYTRNFWRNEVIPLIAERSVKKPVKALNDTYMLLRDDALFLNECADKVYRPLYYGSTPVLHTDDLKGKHNAIATRMVRRLWHDTFGNTVDFAKVHLDAVLSLALASADGTHTADMPFDRVAFRTGGIIGFSKRDDLTSVMCLVAEDMGFLTYTGDLHVRLEDILGGEGENTAFLPNSCIQIKLEIIENKTAIEYNDLSWLLPLYDGRTIEGIAVANHIEGLSFRRAGSSSSKKLSGVLSDMKVPRQSRSALLGVVADGKLLWVPGLGASEGFTNETAYRAWMSSGDASVKSDSYLRVTILREGQDD